MMFELECADFPPTSKAVYRTVLTVGTISLLLFIFSPLLNGCKTRCDADMSDSHFTQSQPIIIPQQEVLLYNNYPEWAQKDWAILILLDSNTHYYVDMGSLEILNDDVSKVMTINNEILFLEESHKVIGTKFPLGMEDFCFPCVKAGKWHPVIEQYEVNQPSDIYKCKECDRYYFIGNIIFQEETGNIEWSRYSSRDLWPKRIHLRK